VDSCLTVDSEAESFLWVFIHHPFTELDDVLLKRFVSRGVIENLPHNPGITRTEHVLTGHADQVADSKT